MLTHSNASYHVFCKALKVFTNLRLKNYHYHDDDDDDDDDDELTSSLLSMVSLCLR